MSTVTPILDTLLHQVLGRRANIERFVAIRPNTALTAITRLPNVYDATTQTGLQAQRALQAEAASTARAAVANEGSRAANVRASNVLARSASAAGRAASRVGATTPGSTQLHFSPGARAIASLLSQYPTAPTAAARAPLFHGTGAPLPHLLAPVLARQLTYSGMFYESHLQQWFEGRHSLKRLSREPQARLNRSDVRSAASGRSTSTPASQVSANPPSTARSAAPTTGAAGASALSAPGGAGMPVSALAAMGTGATAPIHDSLLPVVRQQLDVLSFSLFRWDGLAWPGVPMQWEVEEHETPRDQAGASSDEEGIGHSTRLNLELPVLGRLEIKLTLVANRVRMYAWPASDRGAAALAPQTEVLQQRLERAGFDAASIELLTGMPE